MKRINTMRFILLVLLCAVSAPAFANDTLTKNAEAVLREDMKLYDFYVTQSYSLDRCAELCPNQRYLFDEASGVLAEVLDGAISSVRGAHSGDVNFSDHEAALQKKLKKQFPRSGVCKPCTALADRTIALTENGLPAELQRVALAHSERYLQNPEFEFQDGLTSSVSYRWSSGGKSRVCNFSIPKTWAKDEEQSTRRVRVYRSALGNGIPFFSVTYSPANRLYGETAVHEFLQKRITQKSLEREYGSVEILAQGVQVLGTVNSIWVIFNADGKYDRGAGYYYNWYTLVDGSLLTFHSGVSDSEGEHRVVHEELFRRYHQTLREIAQSAIVR